MKRSLLPQWFRILGISLVAPGIVFGYMLWFQNWYLDRLMYKAVPEQTMFLKRAAYGNYIDEAVLILLIAGLLFIAFARARGEDERTGYIRLSSLYWAFIANSVAYIGCTIFSFQTDWFVDEVWVFSLFTPLVIYIARYTYLDYSSRTLPRPALLPYHPFRKIGIVLSSVFAVTLVLNWFIATSTLWLIFWIRISYFGLMPSLLIWLMSASKTEDEYTIDIRLRAMSSAVIAYYLLCIVAIMSLYEFYFYIFLTYSSFFPLVIFLIIFNVCQYFGKEGAVSK